MKWLSPHVHSCKILATLLQVQTETLSCAVRVVVFQISPISTFINDGSRVCQRQAERVPKPHQEFRYRRSMTSFRGTFALKSGLYAELRNRSVVMSANILSKSWSRPASTRSAQLLVPIARAWYLLVLKSRKSITMTSLHCTFFRSHYHPM